jgi:nucleoside-diphosphate-sugar epimerase
MINSRKIDKILVIGAGGQIGTDLTVELRKKYGNNNVIASDIRPVNSPVHNVGIFEILDVLDIVRLTQIVQKYEISQIYHLAAILSATGEKIPVKAWNINMTGLINILDVSKNNGVSKLFWPSSIAVFGPSTPLDNTPQTTIMDPNTIYGISKLAGERWVEYYYQKEKLDIRSIRYPGLISYQAEPGGGTTDYAVEIYYNALKYGYYECYLSEETSLPMMYMPDAIKATIGLMEAPISQIDIRSSYNVGAISFTPKEIAASIQKYIPDFTITYKSDFRQALADSWPNSVDDSKARADWNWEHDFDLDRMTKDMLDNIKVKIETEIN